MERRSPLRWMPLLTAAAWLAACGGDGRSSAQQPTSQARPSAARASRCDLIAAPNGSDRATGTLRSPLRTPRRLAGRLRPGRTGCLRQGTYRARRRDVYVLRFDNGGRRGAPITLRSFPGERATLGGVVYVPRGADDVRLVGLDVHDRTASDQISIQVFARRTVLAGLDVTNYSHKTCVVLGNTSGDGVARRTVVRDSTIHACGSPEDRLFDHAFYVSNSRRARIVGNVIWNASGYAVHLYPDARRTLVRSNVIVGGGGGVVVAGEGARASSQSLIDHNVISGSRADFNLAAYWGGRVGRGNVARFNCLSAGPGGNVDPELGAAAHDNVEADPGFFDLMNGDFRLRPGTLCAERVGPGVAAASLRRLAARPSR